MALLSQLLFKQRNWKQDRTFKFHLSIVGKRECVRGGQTDRQKERATDKERECGKTGKGAFVFTAEAGMSVCVHGLSISISLTQSLALC